MDGSNHNYEFTNDWFQAAAIKNWDSLVPQIKPRKILEVGSYEGASACYLIGKNDWHEDLELFCIDTWEGGITHKVAKVDMDAVEQRFDHNISVAQTESGKNISVHKMKGMSSDLMPKLIAFDDCLWKENKPHGDDLTMSPKLAIDAFTNVFSRKLKIVPAPLYQLYVLKIAD
ncbi:MAG: hypothetical protein BM562_05850 [Alphaproteobacteria bacterium MedPE-SWcel]|nr:MAG: hypothetical protein BM562_05850 [Alphaproteobacteria bacterium MedPE-SWcel]